jgi:Flp pilus assembly protein TadD
LSRNDVLSFVSGAHRPFRHPGGFSVVWARLAAVLPVLPSMDNPFVQHAELQLLHGSPGEALRSARMGLTLFPDHPELLAIAATCANEIGDDEYALACWQRLLERVPSALAAHNSLALTLERLQRPADAEVIYRQALALLPDDATLHTNLGLLLETCGRFAEAEKHQRRALALAPDSVEIHSNLAGLLLKPGAGAEVEAESLYRAAIRLKPEFAVGHSNLGVLLTDTGRDAEAERCFRRALEIQPDNLQARMNLGQLLLQQGRFAEGWPLYEGRQFVHLKGRTGPVVHPPRCPQWQGEALAGKRLVVMPEQGLGDEIQFVRYLAWLKAQGPAQLTLACRADQRVLLETLDGPDRVVCLEEAGPYLDSHDYWVFLLSLPLHAGTTLANIPATTPYLSLDPLRLAGLAPRLAGAGLRVGLVWRGNPKHSNDAERSLPGLEVLAPVWEFAGVHFFSLQKSAVSLVVPANQPLTDLGPAIGDFADTAAILCQLDLLIAVDTSVAHLAGALGVPCWLLLPCYKTDWRWLLERRDSPWYPSLRLFRQVRRGDWRAPVAALAEELRRFTGGVRAP